MRSSRGRVHVVTDRRVPPVTNGVQGLIKQRRVVYVVSRQIDYEPGIVVGVRASLEEAKTLAADHRSYTGVELEWEQMSDRLSAYTDQPHDKVWVAPNVVDLSSTYPVIEEFEVPWTSTSPDPSPQSPSPSPSSS